jgi:Fe-S-cluster-containing dehydrogenase component
LPGRRRLRFAKRKRRRPDLKSSVQEWNPAMMELQLSLDFACYACDEPVTVTVQCRGKGLHNEREGAVVWVNVPCPTCGQVNQVSFDKDGKVRTVRPYYSPRPLPAPSVN